MDEQAIITKINKEKLLKKYKADLYHITLAVLFFFLALVLFGCSAKPIYKQNIKEVYVPVKCHAQVPQKPKETGSIVLDNINIITYARELEQTLVLCTGGN